MVGGLKLVFTRRFPARVVLNEVCAVVSGDDDGKDDDGQSVASVGEEYEPISDDELDEILADSQKKEDQQDDEKITGIVKFCLKFIKIFE